MMPAVRTSLERTMVKPATTASCRDWLKQSLVLFALLVIGSVAKSDEVDRFIAQERALYDLPAVVVGVIRDGKLIDTRAQGLANIELSVKANAAQVFEIGSISKQFTAYAILILKEHRKLELDAPIGQFLPDLPEPWRKVTLHQLLTHTSGLPDLEVSFGYGIYRETPEDLDLMRRLAALPIEFQPGDKWYYSNTNYWLLGLLIEKLSSMTYAEFMTRNIFAPLGMKSTRSALPHKILAGRAAGYRRVGSALENRDAIQPHTGRGLGDIASTIADMARWEREQLAPRLITPQTAALARRPVKLNSGKEEPYGYGWSTERILPLTSIQHEGQTAGFSATYIRVPEKRVAVVVFSNCYAAPTDSIGKVALRRIEPALRSVRLKPITDTDPHLTRRVGELLSTAGSATSRWQEDWFGPDYWRELKPWLSEVAEFYQRLGSLRSLAVVKRDPVGDEVAVTYRATYPKLSRLVTVRFDDQGHIISRDATDE